MHGCLPHHASSHPVLKCVRMVTVPPGPLQWAVNQPGSGGRVGTVGQQQSSHGIELLLLLLRMLLTAKQHTL